MPTILPSNPTTATPVRLHAEGGGCSVRASAEVDGNTIHYQQTEACLCWSAAPPYSIDVGLGLLPAGEYTLISSYGTYEPEDSGCPLSIYSTEQSSFTVLGGEAFVNHAVPATSLGAEVALLLFVLGAAILQKLRH